MKHLDFIELSISGTEPARCVDGRPSSDIADGGQMLGGSIHPAFLFALTHRIPFTADILNQTLATLTQKGYAIGIHRGTQQSTELGTSDCGFADNLPIIFETTLMRKEDIINRLQAVYRDYQSATQTTDPLPEYSMQAYPLLERYKKEYITLYKEQLIASIEKNGATIEHTQGVHKEEIAFVNLKPYTTLDLHKVHEQGKQAFNLDLWFAVDQSMNLGIEKTSAIGLSLILYQAAAIVLIENAGQPAIPVLIH